MSRTKELFEAVDAYMQTRSDAREEYFLMGRRYEKAKGSPFYDEQMAAAKEKRAQTMEAAQAAARTKVREILSEMYEQAGKITMRAPTPEMLNILQVLRLKDHPTLNDLNEAANALKDSGLCLSVLDEIAIKNKIYTGNKYASMATEGISMEQAREAIRSVAENCERIIKNTHGGNTMRTEFAEQHARHYGGKVNYADIPAEPRFRGVSDFIEQVSGVSYEAFRKAVDAPSIHGS